MELLRHDQLWELSRTRQRELLQEAHRARLGRSVAPQRSWWTYLLRRTPRTTLEVGPPLITSRLPR